MKKDEMQTRLTVKEYARKNRLSIFQVVKKINTGELPCETVTEKGQEIRYIPIDPSKDKQETPEGDRKESSPGSSQSENAYAEELRRLRDELQKLRQLVERCCKNSL